MSEFTEIKSIAEKQAGTVTTQFVETIRKMPTYDWIFSHPVEKIIVAGSFLWTVYSIGSFLFKLI